MQKSAVMKSFCIVCLLIITVSGVEKDCFVAPCKYYGEKTTCVQIGCKKAGLSSECHLNIISNTRPVEKEPVCTTVNEVPGFLDFCQEMIRNASSVGGPPNDINKFSTNSLSSTPTTVTIKESKLVKDDVCYGTTILVSVAVGCYVVGTFLTWVMICCCKLTPCCKGHKKTEEFLTVPNDTPRRNPSSRGRELGSTSSAQLLTNASMETLNTHVTNGSLPNGIEPVASSRESSSRVALWASGNRPSHPNVQWTNERPSYPHARPNLTQWPESVYAPVSESSSRDYQSILGGSENHYVPASESSSDYSGIQTHKVSIIRDGEIYQASSESSGNDYTSLKGQRFGSSRVNESVYYPTSESSYKDYATLSGEADENANVKEETRYVNNDGKIDNAVKVKGAERSFNVSALDLPTSTGSRSWCNKELHDINEYEEVEDKEGFVTVNSGDTLADMCAGNREPVDLSTPQIHEYFKLDPM